MVRNDPSEKGAAGFLPSGGARVASMRWAGRYLPVIGMPLLLAVALLFTTWIHPSFGAFDIQSLALGALPLAFAAAAQTCVVISGGIDLSVGSLIAVANVLAASTMQHADFRQALLLAAGILIAGAISGAINGAIVVLSRIPDVVVTLTTGFIWGGVALLIMEKPGGGAPQQFLDLAAGTTLAPWLPNAVILLIAAVAVVWIPLKLGRAGLLVYAVGSDRVAAFRSGVGVETTRILAYTLSGLFSAMGGLALTMTTAIGAPLAGVYYTLSGLAALVIGGVSLTGGRGGISGPVLAAFVLTLIPTDLIFLNIDPNYGQVIQGTLIVLVVMLGGFVTVLRNRK
jgi:ribose transport system permease protein